MNAWRTQLPLKTQQLLKKYEDADETSHPEYSAAIQILYAKHLCRLNPWPESLQISSKRMALPVYNTMWGPNEFTCTGNLLDWDRTNRLAEINVPTLITCGRFDEVAPACSETMHRGIRDSELVIFENSSHLAHFEEPERYFEVLIDFLLRSETKPGDARRQS
jgi:proline iminopeptidase